LDVRNEKEKMVCCQNLNNIKRIPSPFSRIIILGYYDGATTGALECRECGLCYRFEMLYWDEQQDKRIFGLFPLKRECFERLIEVLQPYSTPGWPWLVVKWEFANSEEKQLVDQQVERLLCQATEISVVIESQNLGKRINLAKRLDPKEFQQILDWKTYCANKKTV
jgi:hypothetical protein